jgi:hypothetical protein
MAGKGKPKGSPKTPGSGRKKGSLNKTTRAHRAALEQLKVDRTDPMSFFISIMRNPDAPFEEVKAAARELFPYSHPKLASVEARGGGKTHEDRLEELRRMEQDDEGE